MDVSFNIPRAGPLSQISVHIISLDTAVHLATGAIGWWKARERSQSLTQSLSACKVSLISTSAFDGVSYRERRNIGVVQGLGVQEGGLCKFPNGVESTAVSQNPGIDCLRALTTGLLCFYSVSLTTIILADIIPFGLLQPEQEDELPTFDGPLYASLKDWVTAVAAEEDCNNFRKLLLQQVSLLQSQLTGIYGLHLHPEDEYDELGLLLGCLRWMVTPEHRRDVDKYPTRSLRVWTTAAVMSELAFSISISLNVVNTTEDFARIVENPEDQYHDVVLIGTSVGNTDPWMVQERSTASLELRPQVFPILSIPYAAFGRLQKQYRKVNADELIDIWKVSFHYARDGVKPPTLSRGGKVHLNTVSRGDYEVIRESHKSLLGVWSPHLARILRPTMDDYVPKTLENNWFPATIKAFFDRINNGEILAFEEAELKNNVYTLTAIILGTIYGACSRSLIPMVASGGEELGVASLEVAFSPDSVFSRKMFDWAADLGQALSGLLDSSRWTGLLLELATGIEHPQPIDEQPTRSLAGRNFKIFDKAEKQSVRISDIFGAQANGVFAVSDFVVRPSTFAENSLLFHVGTGRILNLPIDEDGYLRASQRSMPSSELHLDPEPKLKVISRQVDHKTPPQLRIDAEPHWANDAQTICFVVRNSGTIIANLNMMQLLQKLIDSNLSCSCANPTAEVTVELAERWQMVTMHQLLQRSLSGSSKCAAFVRDQHRIVVDVQDDDARRAFAIGILSCRKMITCKSCLLCAYNKTKEKKLSSIGSAALIIG